MTMQTLESDTRAAEAALTDWHRALELHDWGAVEAGLTAEFLMIEQDRILDRAAVVALLRSSAALGRQRASLHGFRSQVQGDVAWTTVSNDAVWIASDGAETPYGFLETAVFKRDGGIWLIDRYHATRLAKR
ncbi:nuclear transport factor 2 family protein [Duganella sp. BJB475]|nr:nuclear transport factor 2 family protein [Duganella sp. BJB475]RFP28849.1 nuclear transport factor 2 family protein [Duganella sp. BJB476]